MRRSACCRLCCAMSIPCCRASLFSATLDLIYEDSLLPMSISEDEGDRVFEEHGVFGGGFDIPQWKQHPGIALPDLFFDFSSSSPPISSTPGCRALISGPAARSVFPSLSNPSALILLSFLCHRHEFHMQDSLLDLVLYVFLIRV